MAGTICLSIGDGLFDYVTGVNRKCNVCGAQAYDFEHNVLKRLPPFLQQELGFQLSAAAKNAPMLVSTEMENLLQFTMVQGMGAATWETVLHRIQAKTVETASQAWYDKLEHLESAGIVKDASDMAFPTMVEMVGS